MLFESITPVQWWLIAGILLFVFEIFTLGFFLACFGMGAFAAIIPAALGLSIVWQTVFFIVASLLSLFLLRPFMQKRAQKALPHVSTGADALVGRKVLVTETIDPTTDKGRVAVDGDVWTARSLTGEVIEKGMRVEIVSYESIVLNVVVLGNDKQ